MSEKTIWGVSCALSLTLCLHTSQVAHQAGAYPGFSNRKRLEVFLLPLDGMLVYRRVTPSIKFAGTHLFTRVERGTVRVKCLAQEQKHMCLPLRLRPRPLDPEASALTTPQSYVIV